jgi:hypothetical protein
VFLFCVVIKLGFTPYVKKVVEGIRGLGAKECSVFLSERDGKRTLWPLVRKRTIPTE